MDNEQLWLDIYNLFSVLVHFYNFFHKDPSRTDACFAPFGDRQRARSDNLITVYKMLF